MSWWRQNWRWVAGCAAVGLGLIVVLVLWIIRRGEEAAKLRAQLALMQGKLKVAGLEADKKARTKELESNEVAAKALDQEIVAAKKRTVAAVQSIDAMTDEEVVKAFHDMGY